MIKDILLIMPPFSMKERYGRGIEKIGSSLPPLGLLYVGAALEKEGYHVKVFDTQIQDWDIKEAGNSDIAGIYCNTSNYHKAIELAKEIKANFHIPIVFGGPHVTTRPLEVLENGSVDYVVVGEGEISAVELLRSIDNPETVKGIGFKKNGKAIINPGRELIKNLDSLPLPARHLIPIGQYKPSPNQYKRLPMTTMMVSRGCPFNCTFCDVETLWTRLYRSRSVNNVISEIKRLIKDYGIKEINFWDDVWGINKAWIDDFCSQILNEKIDITWSCECRVDTVDGELLKKMKKSSRGEYEIVDAIRKLPNVAVEEAEFWQPATHPWSLLDANEAILKQHEKKKPKIAAGATVEKGATLKGYVSVGKGTLIRSGAYIEGPVVIGENCSIGPNCYIRPFTSIGNGCKVGNAVEVKNSILMEHAVISHISYCADSVIGRNANLGAGTITANLRHDNGNVKSMAKNEPIDTGRRKFGTIIGDGAKTGIHTSIYPGRKIWPGNTTVPGEVVRKDVI